MNAYNNYEPVSGCKKIYIETPLVLRRMVNEVDLEDCSVPCPYYYTGLLIDGRRIIFSFEPIEICDLYILDELYKRNELYNICVRYCLNRSSFRIAKRPFLEKQVYIGHGSLSVELKVSKFCEPLFDMYLARNNFIPDFDIEILDFESLDEAGDQ